MTNGTGTSAGDAASVADGRTPHEKGNAMADLVAIGYPDEVTAQAAADEVCRLARDLIIQPDAIAVMVRDQDGSYHVHTSQHAIGGGAVWGMLQPGTSAA
jgi:hypothetical protein